MRCRLSNEALNTCCSSRTFNRCVYFEVITYMYPLYVCQMLSQCQNCLQCLFYVVGYFYVVARSDCLIWHIKRDLTAPYRTDKKQKSFFSNMTRHGSPVSSCTCFDTAAYSWCGMVAFIISPGLCRLLYMSVLRYISVKLSVMMVCTKAREFFLVYCT